jgi:hypothetical protein
MFLTPGWVALHLVVIALSVTMVLLGRWQLNVSDSKHFNLQNFGYALQWWAFTAGAILLWLRIMRDAWRTANGELIGPGVQIVRATKSNSPAYAGPAELVTVPTKPGVQPLIYRGYLMPQSRTTLASSEGDLVHGAYNDYLWQLAMSDNEVPSAGPDPRSFDDDPVRERARRPEPTPPDPKVIGPGAGSSPDSANSAG